MLPKPKAQAQTLVCWPDIIHGVAFAARFIHHNYKNATRFYPIQNPFYLCLIIKIIFGER
jgi:hypothetical protein